MNSFEGSYDSLQVLREDLDLTGTKVSFEMLIGVRAQPQWSAGCTPT